jgi:hypothetical protein
MRVPSLSVKSTLRVGSISAPHFPQRSVCASVISTFIISGNSETEKLEPTLRVKWVWILAREQILQATQFIARTAERYDPAKAARFLAIQ